MKKSLAGIVLVLLIFTILIPNTTSAAQISEPHALIVPGSIFYGYKIFGEWLKQKIVSIGGTQAEMNYVFQRIQNRAAEMNTLYIQGKIDSNEYITARNQAADLRQEFNNLLGKIQESDRWKILQQKKIDPGLPDEEYFRGDNYANLISQKMDDVNKQILAAQDSGDDAKVASLTNQLKELKKSYTDANIILPSFAETEKQQLAQTENLLANTDKINYALDWANKYKQMIADTSKNEIYKGNEDLFSNANKTIDDLISNLKKIPLDNIDNKKLDDLFSQAKGALNDTARAIWQKSTSKNTINQPPIKNIQQQAPAVQVQNNQVPRPAQQKQTLKKIYSTSVSTTKPTLIGGNYFQGQVGVNFSTTFDGSNGLAPYHFQLGSGGGFPPMHITLAPNGVLSGTPSIKGDSTFDVCVIDSAGLSDCQSVTVSISPKAVSDLHIDYSIPSVFPVIGIGYEADFAKDSGGGTPPYHFELDQGSTLPPGMNLSGNGLLSGSPTAMGTYTFRVCIIDAAGDRVCRGDFNSDNYTFYVGRDCYTTGYDCRTVAFNENVACHNSPQNSNANYCYDTHIAADEVCNQQQSQCEQNNPPNFSFTPGEKIIK